jgi:hypothetical protein
MAATVLFAFAAGVIAVPLGLAISGSQGLSSPGNIAEAFGILMGSFTIAGLAGGLAAGLIASGTPGCLAVFGGCLVAVVGAGWANAALLVPFLLTGIGAGFGAGVVVRRLRERRRVG